MSGTNGSSRQFKAAQAIELGDEGDEVEMAILASLTSKTESNLRYIDRVDTDLAKLVQTTNALRAEVQTVSADVRALQDAVEGMAEKVGDIPEIMRMLGAIMARLPEVVPGG